MVINAKKPKHVQRDAMKCLDGRGGESMVYVLSIRILICCTYQGCTDEVRIVVPVWYRMSIYFYSVCSFCCSSAGIETVKVSLRTNYLRKKRERKRSEAMVSNMVSWRFTRGLFKNFRHINSVFEINKKYKENFNFDVKLEGQDRTMKPTKNRGRRLSHSHFYSYGA